MRHLTESAQLKILFESWKGLSSQGDNEGCFKIPQILSPGGYHQTLLGGTSWQNKHPAIPEEAGKRWGWDRGAADKARQPGDSSEVCLQSDPEVPSEAGSGSTQLTEAPRHLYACVCVHERDIKMGEAWERGNRCKRMYNAYRLSTGWFWAWSRKMRRRLMRWCL